MLVSWEMTVRQLASQNCIFINGFLKAFMQKSIELTQIKLWQNGIWKFPTEPQIFFSVFRWFWILEPLFVAIQFKFKLVTSSGLFIRALTNTTVEYHLSNLFKEITKSLESSYC